MNNINVHIVADSTNDLSENRITTMLLTYPRFIHGEVMTHRVFSRNGQSSRAIPVFKTIKQVWSDPVTPTKFEHNKAGMQSSEPMKGLRLWFAKLFWFMASRFALMFAWFMVKVGLHKQWANRILEPFQTMTLLVTSTEWDNFLTLRDHPDAQPEIQLLAKKIKEALRLSVPKRLKEGEWHIPFVRDSERNEMGIEALLKISTARCARTSYLTHDNQRPSIIKDFELYDLLVTSKPIHASPAEHQAMCSSEFIRVSIDNPKSKIYPDGFVFLFKKFKLQGNFKGWIQHRKLIENNLTIKDI